MAQDYAEEKFGAALEQLEICFRKHVEAGMRQWLLGLALETHTLQPTDFPDEEDRRVFTECWETLRRAEDPVRGSIAASADALSNEEARRWLTSYVKLGERISGEKTSLGSFLQEADY